MNKVFVQTSVGELIDKMTILEIKREKISDKKSLDIINGVMSQSMLAFGKLKFV